MCKRVISSPLMRCRRDDPRAIYVAVSLFLSRARESSPLNPRRQDNLGRTSLRALGTPRYCLFYWSVRLTSSNAVSDAAYGRDVAEKKKSFRRILRSGKCPCHSRAKRSPISQSGGRTAINETDCDESSTSSLSRGRDATYKYIRLLWKTPRSSSRSE